MKTAEIRSKFLEYFQSQGHTVVESSSVVPSNDPTLLFTSAGMVQFKDVFLGRDPRPYTRAASCQKCVRAGGKHNDLENVGFTARHHTFFEMLGNFSFGDYFKKEAIRYAWQFVTEVLKLPKDRLYVTVFETDDEAADIWHKQEGIPKDRIYRFGEKDNFWSMGETGPCGPCSEIFIDRGEKYSCGKPTCGMGCDCDRYMEFWNLVFMQFNRDSGGNLTPLPKPSVDTGAGLERIAMILQEVDTNYDTDGFHDIIQRTAELARLEYIRKDETAFSFRVIADHSRATAFLIADGVMPSNEGRGYVLRRIMRRAIRHGKKLGFRGPFLHKTAGFVIDQMKDAYPALVDQRAFIEKAVLAEEEQFFKTLERGLSLMDDEVAKLGPGGTLPGVVAFKLYDTYGFPLDLTRVILEEKGFRLDEKGFTEWMEAQKAASRKSWKGTGQEAIDSIYLKLAQDLKAAGKMPKFTGYNSQREISECVALLQVTPKGVISVSGYTTVPTFSLTKDSPENDLVLEAVFAITPFYGESGGQVGDRGRVTAINTAEFEAEVIDVQKPVPDLIVVTLKPLHGSINKGMSYVQETDRELRAMTAKNHTATHMLQWALREILGKHVKQAGSLVAPDLLRFDFTHFQALTESEIEKIEILINQKIWAGAPVTKKEMKKDEAIQMGAIAMFGEKYGDVVRVVKVGDYSTELCGGTHVDSSSDINLFKIANETGIAAGVRRMIAYTSKGAFDYLNSRDIELKKLREKLKANTVEEVSGRIDKIIANEKDTRRQLEAIFDKATAIEVDQILSMSSPIRGGRLVANVCSPDSQGMKKLRDLADKIKQKAPDSVVVLGMKDPDSEKASLVVAIGPKAPKDYQAGSILNQLSPLIEAKGGGKPDFAQAGGTKASGLAQLVNEARKLF